MLHRTDFDPLRQALLTWYRANRRDLPWRRSSDPYAVWVSEAMLQQTQVATVIPYYIRFMGLFPTVAALAAADTDAVLKAWEGLGYYSRARNLQRAARVVVANHEGKMPSDPTALARLPGIGPYILAALGSIAFDLALAVVDGNVKRVLARLVASPLPVNTPQGHKAFQTLADRLLDRQDPGTFNQALMELGALVCKPKAPLCLVCPLKTWCRALARGTPESFPRKTPRKAVPLHHLAAAVIFKNGRILVVRRPENGMLGGLWEFPTVRIIAKEDPVAACRRAAARVGIEVSRPRPLAPVRHAYTHLKVVVHGHCCNFVGGRVRRDGHTAHRWVTLNGLNKLAFHKVQHKLTAQLFSHSCVRYRPG